MQWHGAHIQVNLSSLLRALQNYTTGHFLNPTHCPRPTSAKFSCWHKNHSMMEWEPLWKKKVHPKFFQNPFLWWPWVVWLGIRTWSAIEPFYFLKSLLILEKITNLLHIFTMKKAYFFFIGPYGRSSSNAQPDYLLAS